MVLYATNKYSQQSFKFSGVVELIQTHNNPIRFGKKSEKVLVVVYKTSSNHFAVLYPLWGLDCSRKPICKINLLSTKVDKCVDRPDKLDKEFSIVSKREGISFTFRISDKNKENHTVDDWVEALSTDTNDCPFFVNPTTKVYKSKQIQLNLSVLNEEEVNEEND